MAPHYSLYKELGFTDGNGSMRPAEPKKFDCKESKPLPLQTAPKLSQRIDFVVTRHNHTKLQVPYYVGWMKGVIKE